MAFDSYRKQKNCDFRGTSPVRSLSYTLGRSILVSCYSLCAVATVPARRPQTVTQRFIDKTPSNLMSCFRSSKSSPKRTHFIGVLVGRSFVHRFNILRDKSSNVVVRRAITHIPSKNMLRIKRKI